MEWEEWRCVRTMSGAPSVMKNGTISMPQWLVERSGLIGVSLVLSVCVCVCLTVAVLLLRW